MDGFFSYKRNLRRMHFDFGVKVQHAKAWFSFNMTLQRMEEME